MNSHYSLLLSQKPGLNDSQESEAVGSHQSLLPKIKEPTGYTLDAGQVWAKPGDHNCRTMPRKLKNQSSKKEGLN